MNVCDICGYKVVANKMFEKHLLTHEVEYPKEGDLNGEGVSVEKKAEPVVEPVEPELITLRFTKPIEIIINGIRYEGKELKIADMSTAGEIVRIAREAYGASILA